VGPDIVGYAHLNRQLQEHFVLKEVLNIWQGPKHPEYCGLIDRVHSFKHVVWPETSPTRVSLAEAGFFYEGELTTFNSFPLANTICGGQVFIIILVLVCNRLEQANGVIPLRDRTSGLAS